MSERTLVLVKPDGVRRGLIGEVINRLERKGLMLMALELRTISRETAREHYQEHTERAFFGDLVDFITSGPLVAMVVAGPQAVQAARTLMGATDPVQALPGSVRGDFAIEIRENVVHSSDSPESGLRESKLFFPQL